MKCYVQKPVREPFMFLSARAVMLLITTAVLLSLISYYYDVAMGLQKSVFFISFVSLVTAYSIGSLIYRFNVKGACLKILTIMFLFASNVFFFIGLAFSFLTKPVPILDFLIFMPFSIIWMGASILYSLRIAYNLLHASRC
ncbi:MAG: hypothetical protein FGF53_06165, partial [Candidatus Brockarchaeota archaeon]|nr:hypothetical protein [Candidatus Brockarchaeota archaeon]